VDEAQEVGWRCGCGTCMDVGTLLWRSGRVEEWKSVDVWMSGLSMEMRTDGFQVPERCSDGM
jgi:hypothetical protein